MLKQLLVAALLVSAALAVAAPAPVRSGTFWQIVPQQSEADWQSLAQGTNLLAGRTLNVQPQPNYQHSSDVEDLKQLTDGALAAPAREIMTRKAAVGWAYTERVRWLADLGQSQALGRLVFRLQVLNTDNNLPRSLSISLSEDGASFVPVRNLSLKLSPEDDPDRVYEPLGRADGGRCRG